MWNEFWLSFEKAFALMGAGDKMLSEIVATTMQMAIISSLLAFLIGVPIGIFIATSKFKGKRIVTMIVRTLMGLPPVAVGIVIYMLFSGTGPFGSLGLIYSVQLMIVAQVVLITPIVVGMTETAISPLSERMLDTAKGLRLNKFKVMTLSVNEGKFQLVAVYMFAFARATAEVGAVQIVGGNILHKTRIMTTAIALNYSTGEFQLALALGIILLIIALSVNLIAVIIQGVAKR